MRRRETERGTNVSEVLRGHGHAAAETECLEVGRMGHTDVLEHFGLLRGGGYRGSEALECYTASLWGVMDSR